MLLWILKLIIVAPKIKYIFKQGPPRVGFILSVFLYNSRSNNNKTLTMKTKIITTILFLIILTGCDNQSKVAEASNSTEIDSSIANTKFEKSDKKISTYLDQLDDPNTPQEARIQILCKDYPNEYKTNYMPALMKLSPGEYTEGKLIKDLDIALDYYKKKDNVQC